MLCEQLRGVVRNRALSVSACLVRGVGAIRDLAVRADCRRRMPGSRNRPKRGRTNLHGQRASLLVNFISKGDQAQPRYLPTSVSRSFAFFPALFSSFGALDFGVDRWTRRHGVTPHHQNTFPLAVVVASCAPGLFLARVPRPRRFPLPPSPPSLPSSAPRRWRRVNSAVSVRTPCPSVR
jgi:hypothetical protein